MFLSGPCIPSCDHIMSTTKAVEGSQPAYVGMARVQFMTNDRSNWCDKIKSVCFPRKAAGSGWMVSGGQNVNGWFGSPSDLSTIYWVPLVSWFYSDQCTISFTDHRDSRSDHHLPRRTMFIEELCIRNACPNRANLLKIIASSTTIETRYNK